MAAKKTKTYPRPPKKYPSVSSKYPYLYPYPRRSSSRRSRVVRASEVNPRVPAGSNFLPGHGWY